MRNHEQPVTPENTRPYRPSRLRRLAAPLVTAVTAALPGNVLATGTHTVEQPAAVITLQPEQPTQEATGNTNEVIITIPGHTETNPGVEFSMEPRETVERIELHDHIPMKYQRGYEVDQEDIDMAYEEMKAYVELHPEIFDNLDKIESIYLYGWASAEDGEGGETPNGGLDTPSQKNAELAAQRLMIGSAGLYRYLEEKYGADYVEKFKAMTTTGFGEQVLTPTEMSTIQSMADSLGMTPREMINSHDRVIPNPLPTEVQDELNKIITDRRGVDIVPAYKKVTVTQVAVPHTVAVTTKTPDSTRIISVPDQAKEPTTYPPVYVTLPAESSSVTDYGLLPTFKAKVGKEPRVEGNNIITSSEPNTPDSSLPVAPKPPKRVALPVIIGIPSEVDPPFYAVPPSQNFKAAQHLKGKHQSAYTQTHKWIKQPGRGNYNDSKPKTHSAHMNRRGRA